MATLTVEHGVCGFTTTVTAENSSDYMVEITIDTDCPNIASVPKTMLRIDPVLEMTPPGTLGQSIAKFLPHASCLIIPAIIKAAEVEAGLALKKDAGIRFEQ